MTDDKAAGEGPYKHSDYHRTTRAHAVSCSACAYAAGRKAERERCAKIAESHVTKLNGFQMESEGPYEHILASNKEWCVFACPKCAYDKGRKSMEKDFKELLDLANEMNWHKEDYWITLERFKAWKKERGIE